MPSSDESMAKCQTIIRMNTKQSETDWKQSAVGNERSVYVRTQTMHFNEIIVLNKLKIKTRKKMMMKMRQLKTYQIVTLLIYHYFIHRIKPKKQNHCIETHSTDRWRNQLFLDNFAFRFSSYRCVLQLRRE